MINLALVMHELDKHTKWLLRRLFLQKNKSLPVFVLKAALKDEFHCLLSGKEGNLDFMLLYLLYFS